MENQDKTPPHSHGRGRRFKPCCAHSEITEESAHKVGPSGGSDPQKVSKLGAPEVPGRRALSALVLLKGRLGAVHRFVSILAAAGAR